MTERFIFCPLNLLIIADSKINEDKRLIYFIEIYDKRKIYKYPDREYWWKNYIPMKNTFRSIILELQRTGTLEIFNGD